MATSCSNSSTGPDPDPGATTGALKVDITTTGSGTDDDGYEVVLEDQSVSVETNGSATFDDLDEGTYNITINGLGSGCSVDGENPISAQITAGETTNANFEVICEQFSAEGIIAFSQTVDQQLEIFTVKPDGTELQQLTNFSLQDQYPVISPDGKKIVFSRQDKDSPTVDNDIWVMNIDGSNAIKLTDNTVDDKRPSWSPDGSQIVFESGKNSFSIYVMDADGSNQTQLTDDEGQDHSASWSADNKIAFVSDRQGDSSADIYQMDADGSNAAILISAESDNGINLSNPAWSPDGSQIVYQGFASGGSPRIFLADAEGSNIQMIEPDGNNNDARQPSWSPDGNYITFLELANSENSDAIWIIEPDGLNAIRLTDNEANRLGFPRWGIEAN
ncbi:TolB family protein [Fodinibius salsisoli]|uniref:PD40 domain-containing protein n=1 Tax=Fodinibius salsisoli TaxID=2820877 RepID=A0ABT3PN31_9BACT|nr:DUF5050 domain-containing protein [Fodinibius salsisoli]MCW9707188.1 PD40 domain-containing protein [Fodinibius salsisoli]